MPNLAQVSNGIIRPAVLSDLDFMRQMLFLALNERVEADCSIEPDEALRYLANWGRDGDCGVVATAEEGQPVGAAWLRMYSYEEPGAGFVSPFLPELIGAVCEAERGSGIGKLMLNELLAQAKAMQCAFVSAAVVRESPGENLLKLSGFADAGLSEEDDPLIILLSCL